MKGYLLSVLVATVLVICNSADEHTAIRAESCGQKVQCTLNGKTVTISGSGPMYDYESDYRSPFFNNKVVETVVVESGVTTIGRSAFDGCVNISRVTLSSTITTIKVAAFNGCKKLTSIHIPASVQLIESAFSTVNMKRFTVDAGNENYSDKDGILYNHDGTTLVSYPCAKGDTFTSDVTSIHSGAFSGCSNLKSVKLVDGMKTIESSLFAGCSSLTEIKLPSSITTIRQWAFSSCSGLKTVNIPEGVSVIEQYAFQYCTSLESISIPSSVTSIGKSAFSYSGLKSVTIPASVTKIDQDAFRHMSKLKSVKFLEGSNSGSTSIGIYAFSQCSALENVSISSRVTTIEDGAFSDCVDMRSFIVSKKNPSFLSLNGVLFSKNKTTLIQYPCSRANEYTVPEGVTTIGYAAFRKCSDLSDVILSPTMTTLEGYAFEDCFGLTNIAIPASVTSFGMSPFLNCVNLASVTYYGATDPDPTNSKKVFSYCKRLNTVCVISDYDSKKFCNRDVYSTTTDVSDLRDQVNKCHDILVCDSGKASVELRYEAAYWIAQTSACATYYCDNSSGIGVDDHCDRSGGVDRKCVDGVCVVAGDQSSSDESSWDESSSHKASSHKSSSHESSSHEPSSNEFLERAGHVHDMMSFLTFALMMVFVALWN